MCSNKQSSKAEIIIYNIISRTYPDIRHRAKVNGIEYDIYIPSLRLAIEYDGSFWHKGKTNTHIKKLENAMANNIRLINIMEYNVGKEKPIDRYCNKHIIVEFPVTKAYNIIESLYACVYSIFKGLGITLNYVDIRDVKDTLDTTISKVATDNSLYAKYPWLITWYSTNNKLSIKEIGKGVQDKIELICPECGIAREIKVHYIQRIFVGCSKCGCKRDIPAEHLNKIRETNKRAYERSKKKKESGI